MPQTIVTLLAGDRVALNVDVAGTGLNAGDLVWVKHVDRDAVTVTQRVEGGERRCWNQRWT